MYQSNPSLTILSHSNPRGIFRNGEFATPGHKESAKPRPLGQKNRAETPPLGQLFSKIQQKITQNMRQK